MSTDNTEYLSPDFGLNKPGVEDIQRLILQRICFLDYLPGDRLKETELAQEFNVSRTPVRDAISRINHLGLVETRNGVGTVVAELSQRKIADVYDMRLELSILIGQCTPMTIDASHCNRISVLKARAQQLLSVFDTREYILLNDQLNMLISDLIGNSVLRSFWIQAYYQAASTWHRLIDRSSDDVVDSMISELTSLETAMNERDMLAVGYIQRIYIGYGYTRIKRHIFNSAD